MAVFAETFWSNGTEEALGGYGGLFWQPPPKGDPSRVPGQPQHMLHHHIHSEPGGYVPPMPSSRAIPLQIGVDLQVEAGLTAVQVILLVAATTGTGPITSGGYRVGYGGSVTSTCFAYDILPVDLEFGLAAELPAVHAVKVLRVGQNDGPTPGYKYTVLFSVQDDRGTPGGGVVEDDEGFVILPSIVDGPDAPFGAACDPGGGSWPGAYGPWKGGVGHEVRKDGRERERERERERIQQEREKEREKFRVPCCVVCGFVVGVNKVRVL